MGPIEYVMVAFPGNKFNGEIVPALKELLASGVIRVVDLLFIKKDADGNVTSYELDTIPAEEVGTLGGFSGGMYDLLSLYSRVDLT